MSDFNDDDFFFPGEIKSRERQKAMVMAFGTHIEGNVDECGNLPPDDTSDDTSDTTADDSSVAQSTEAAKNSNASDASVSSETEQYQKDQDANALAFGTPSEGDVDKNGDSHLDDPIDINRDTTADDTSVAQSSEAAKNSNASDASVSSETEKSQRVQIAYNGFAIGLISLVYSLRVVLLQDILYQMKFNSETERNKLECLAQQLDWLDLAFEKNATQTPGIVLQSSEREIALVMYKFKQLYGALLSRLYLVANIKATEYGDRAITLNQTSAFVFGLNSCLSVIDDRFIEVKRLDDPVQSTQVQENFSSFFPAMPVNVYYDAKAWAQTWSSEIQQKATQMITKKPAIKREFVPFDLRSKLKRLNVLLKNTNTASLSPQANSTLKRAARYLTLTLTPTQEQDPVLRKGRQEKVTGTEFVAQALCTAFNIESQKLDFVKGKVSTMSNQKNLFYFSDDLVDDLDFKTSDLVDMTDMLRLPEPVFVSNPYVFFSVLQEKSE